MVITRPLQTMKQFHRDRRGVTAIEYSLIAALIGLVIIVGATTIGTTLNTTFASISTSLTAASADEPEDP
jgi:pilus assembly protein Flp/PilA